MRRWWFVRADAVGSVLNPLFCTSSRRDSIVPSVSKALLAKYDVAGPRYTSYPAVPDWRGAFDAATWSGHLGVLGTTESPLALYVHLPFCASRCLYCGCNATVTTRSEIVDRYLERLQRELDMLARSMGARPRVVEMHWGGGTPNFLGDGQLAQLHTMLQRTFEIDARTECSVEADPRLVNRAQLRTLRQLGFSRISYGVQDLDPVVQQAIGRLQPEELVADCVQMAREEGFGGINLDLIYGLPHQSPERFARTVEGSLALNPDRVACFGYAHVPWMRAHQKRIDESALPVAYERFALFQGAVRRFVESGYKWIGIDHFARPEDPLALAADAGRLHRNFMGYTTRSGEHLLGVGTSAISEVGGWFVQNAPELGGWQRDIDAGHLPVARGHVMTDDDRARGAAIAHLMCNAELPFDMFVGDVEPLVDRYEQFAADGLVVFETDRLAVTPLGRFFLRNLAFPLDGYRSDLDGARRFSRAV
jgi:oxygen-independent coproporphyrinogen-3 oxidase